MIKIEYEEGVAAGALINNEKIRHADILTNDFDEVVLEVESHNDERTFRNVTVEEFPERVIFNLYYFRFIEDELLPDLSWTLSVKREKNLVITFYKEIEFPNVLNRSLDSYVMSFLKKVAVLPTRGCNLTIDQFLHSSNFVDSDYRASFKFEFANSGSVMELINKAKDVLRSKLEPIYEDIRIKPIKVFCEGKTDYLHLKSALRYFQRNEKFSLLTLEFCDSADVSGDADLEKFCTNVCKVDTNEIILAIFDNDSKIGRSQFDEGENYKDWGNNVFSMKLPEDKKSTLSDICIELYYDTETFKRKNIQGRRLFLRSEFSDVNGRHSDGKYYLTNPKNKSLIVDPVYDIETGENIALSKNDFSQAIFEEKEPFENVSFESFDRIFNVINEIKAKQPLETLI